MSTRADFEWFLREGFPCRDAESVELGPLQLSSLWYWR